MKKALLITTVLFAPLLAFPQKTAEFTAAVGGTIIDIENLVETDEISGSYATDWGTVNFGISGQYFFLSKGNISLGAELMYQDLYWYSVRIPYGTTPINREYSVSAVKTTPVLRFGGNGNFAFDIGPEFNFMDGVNLGLLLSADYFIKVSDKFDIPVKARLDVIDNIVITMPASLNVGIRLKL